MKTRKAMRQAAIDAWFYMQHWYDNFPKEKRYWPDRHYASSCRAMTTRPSPSLMRIASTSSIAPPSTSGVPICPALSDTPATQYLMCLADNNGKLLEAGQLYKLTIPAKMPVKQFWALTVYNRDTMSFIYSESGRTTLSSYDLDKMAKNPDGSITLYVGPTARQARKTTGSRPVANARCRPCVSMARPTN
jgi:hypothetical protein